jgi:hypothetical protein
VLGIDFFVGNFQFKFGGILSYIQDSVTEAVAFGTDCYGAFQNTTKTLRNLEFGRCVTLTLD